MYGTFKPGPATRLDGPRQAAAMFQNAGPPACCLVNLTVERWDRIVHKSKLRRKKPGSVIYFRSGMLAAMPIKDNLGSFLCSTLKPEA